MMPDAFDRDERASAGKTLILPSPPWGVKRPTPVDHYVVPSYVAPNPRHVARRAEALALADRVVSAFDPDRLAQVRALQAAHAAALAEHRAVVAELAELAAPLDAGADLATSSARARRRADLAAYVTVLAERQRATGAAAGLAVQELRADLGTAAHTSVLAELRAEQAAIVEQIERLEARRVDVQLIVMDVRARLATVGSDAYPLPAPPVAPEAPAVPRRRGLFG